MMRTQRMPGFSAEASLCRRRAHYQGVSISHSLGHAGKGMIQPALPPRLEKIGCRSGVDPEIGVYSCCHAKVGNTIFHSCCGNLGCTTSTIVNT
jgi:hypothetical protein